MSHLLRVDSNEKLLHGFKAVLPGVAVVGHKLLQHAQRQEAAGSRLVLQRPGKQRDMRKPLAGQRPAHLEIRIDALFTRRYSFNMT
jgi:hypothetical protein